MFDVVLAALRSRRSATIALWLLTCLVIAGVTAAPCVLYTTIDRVTTADATEAPAAQRTVVLTATVNLTMLSIGGTTTDTSGVAPAVAQLERALTIPQTLAVSTLEVDGVAQAPVRGSLAYAYRADVCAHATITGACPSGLGEAIVSTGYATALGLHIGDALPWSAPSQGPAAALRVVGFYQPLAPHDPYWGSDLLAADQPLGSSRTDAVFVTTATLEANSPSLRCVRMVIVTPAAVKAYGTGRIDRDITAARDLATARDYAIDTDFTPLAQRIAADRSYTTVTIGAIAIELVAFGWFALYLVLRSIAAARRPDVGIHLLHGVPRRRIVALAALQDALPVLVALPVGAIAGLAGAWRLAGALPADRNRAAAMFAGCAVGAVVLGAILAAAIAERRASRGSIPDLLRNTPPTRRGWRAAVLDLVVFAIAAAAVVQVRLGGGTAGLAAVAATLVAVAIAVVAARLLGPVCRWAIAGSLRRGRPAGVLAATYLARRRGLDRLLILLVVAVATFTGSAVSLQVGTDARATRAVQELGADRVVELRDVTVAQVLADTRAADPGGRYLMAVSSYAGGGVLAVDSSRLGTVLDGSGGWPGGTAMARDLDTPTTAPTVFRNGPIAMSMDASLLPAAPVVMTVDLTDAAGNPSTLTYGPITAGARDYTADLSSCPAGCSVVDLRVVPADPAASDKPVKGFTGVIRALGPAGDPAGGVTALADRARWRTSGLIDVVGPALATTGEGLQITLANDSLSGEVAFDARVYPIDAPLPLPAIAAGPPQPGGSTVATVAPYSDLTIPVRVAARTPVLPQLGTAGMLVDLTDALRLDGGLGAGGTPQIWMRAGTPPAVAHRVLAGRGIVSDRTLGSVRGRLAAAAPAIVARFALVGGLIAILAAVTAMVLTDSFERGTDLAALRRQGLRTATIRRTAYARHAALTLGALVAGAGAALLARLVLRTPDTVFSDGWREPPAPHPSVSGWSVAIAAVAVPLVLAAAYAARNLVARATGGSR